MGGKISECPWVERWESLKGGRGLDAAWRNGDSASRAAEGGPCLFW